MSIFIRVPATSANLGPGFDVLGLALSLYAEVGCIEVGEPLPERAQQADEHHLALLAFRSGGGTGDIWVRSPIPMGRGLGYSAAVRVGGLLAAHVQQRGPDPETLSRERVALLDQAIALEGHADNAAAALLGGFVACAGGHAVRLAMKLDPVVVCWVPSFSTRTDHSRARLSSEVTRDDAVFNVGRTALLVAALVAGDVAALRVATEDRLHQAVRFQHAPQSFAAYQAALDSGAWASWLSGSGPTVASMCLREDADRIASALPVDGVCKILSVDQHGATVHV